MPDYSFAFMAFEDMTVDSGNPLSTFSTTGANGSFTVDGDASPVVLTITDDDDEFDDAYIDPGSSQTLQSPVTVNGTTFPAGSVVELEFSVDVDSGEEFFYIRINGQNVGIGGTTLPQPGESYTITGSSDGQDTPYDSMPCFVSGTRIATADGPCPVEELRAGDMVLTADDGLQPVLWRGERCLSLDELATHPRLWPVEIEAGALGNLRSLRVSPQHRMLLTDWRAELYFGTSRVLVPAKALVNGTTIRQIRPNHPVAYHHILFARHQVVFSEGVASESFHPGQQGIAGLAEPSRRELLALFPELQSHPESYGASAYPAMRLREALAAIHPE